MKVISLYSGAGGLDYGIEAAGFETAVAVEMDKWCCETLRANREWAVIENKIEDVTSQQILSAGDLKKGEAKLLIGGPPCQPFSKSGYWRTGDAARLEDPRAQTLEQYMRVLEDTLPEVFILENVFGLAYKGKDEGLHFLKERLQNINRKNKVNYSFNWKVLNAAHYGVPQIRERVFIVGSRDGKDFLFPEAQFFLPSERNEISLFDHASKLQPVRTAWDAIGDLDDSSEEAETSKVGGQWGDLLPSIPEGENYLWHTARGNGKPLFAWRSRYWSFLLKLAKNKPSWTIQAQPGSAIGPFHWKNRRLTMREMARIQTFPDDVQILGGVSMVQRQLGNAVPSLLAEVLGRQIRKQFFGHKISVTALKLLPPDRSPTPKPEPVFKVKSKYKPVKASERSLRDEKQI
jgi:DNA (cytosine-5)-methyltransferase 1